MSEIDERPAKIRKIESNPDVATKSSLEPTIQDIVVGSTYDFKQEQDLDAYSNEKPKISKNQLKKLKKRERWEAGKEQRTIKRREKHKEKQARKAEKRAQLEAKILSGEIPAPKVDESEEDKLRRIPGPKQAPIGLILDTDFNDLMTEKEIISLGSQLTRCYSLNKTARYRAYLAISSWGGVLKARFENVLASTHLNWNYVSFLEDQDFIAAGHFLHDMMTQHGKCELAGALATNNILTAQKAEIVSIENTAISGSSADSARGILHRTLEDKVEQIPEENRGVLSEFQKEARSSDSEPINPSTLETKAIAPSIVYLTSDSPHVLTRLEPNTSYVIGGIVDKNRHKGLCYKRACERGIPTAKLPIGEYMKMQSRTVLAVNHVVEIMLKWLETGDWGEAFLSVIPKRKQAELRTKDQAENGVEESSHGNDRRDDSVDEVIKSKGPSSR